MQFALLLCRHFPSLLFVSTIGPRGSDGELSAAQYAFRPSVVPYALRADTKPVCISHSYYSSHLYG